MADGIPSLRRFDDGSLLEMYDVAHELGDENCYAITAELIWRGIEVTPCGQEHGAA